MVLPSQRNFKNGLAWTAIRGLLGSLLTGPVLSCRFIDDHARTSVESESQFLSSSVSEADNECDHRFGDCTTHALFFLPCLPARTSNSASNFVPNMVNIVSVVHSLVFFSFNRGSMAPIWLVSELAQKRSGQTRARSSSPLSLKAHSISTAAHVQVSLPCSADILQDVSEPAKFQRARTARRFLTQ
jgi:hypothetical protein